MYLFNEMRPIAQIQKASIGTAPPAIWRIWDSIASTPLNFYG
jgi:hypothetical protein